MSEKQIQFGLKIKELRNKHHFTVRQVSQQAGISSSFWSLVENGKRNIPKPVTLEKMAHGLREPKEKILELAGLDTSNNNNKENKHVDLADDDVVMSYEGKPIPPEDLEVMRRFLRGGKNNGQWCNYLLNEYCFW